LIGKSTLIDVTASRSWLKKRLDFETEPTSITKDAAEHF
jgi:hypothetical protein